MMMSPFSLGLVPMRFTKIYDGVSLRPHPDGWSRSSLGFQGHSDQEALTVLISMDPTVQDRPRSLSDRSMTLVDFRVWICAQRR
jgi:hypothetical protein